RASAKVLIGRAHYRRGDHQEAVRICTEAIVLDGSYAEAYFERANSLRMLGQYAASIEDCEKGLSTEADSAYGLVIRGLCRAELGNRQEALEDYQRAVQLGETSHLVVWALAFLGDLARQDADYAFAVDYATRAIDVEYDRAMESEYCDAMSQAYVVRAASRRALGQCDQAVEDCTRALSHVPTNALALVERGASHRALGDYERAVDDCGEAVQLQPRLWLAYHERAYALLAKHRGDGMQLAGNVVELPAILRDPIGAADVSFEIGRTARGPHSLTPAEQEQNEPRDGAGEPGPSASPRPYLLEPVLREDDQGREVHPLDQAVSDFQMLLQADFDTASTACGLAQCLHELGKLAEAEDVCNRELSRDDTNAHLHVARAMVLYSAGRHLDGLDAAKKAVAANAAMPEAKLAEAYGLALTSAWPEARHACEQLLQLETLDIIAARGLLLWYACWTMEMDGRGTADSATQALADMLAQTGARTDRWPGPIVSALVDGQDLADLASRIPPTVEEHVRQRQLCQVLFYLGVRDLGAGEVILAKKRLQAAVEVGNARHMEYLLSDIQLRRLGTW
ncbi:MAG: tetratricopeptide repeat protein, partial [Planctomycetes bacterium]|nr:tetratricopeptide repeat protein [Planctomycetota bacterium]